MTAACMLHKVALLMSHYCSCEAVAYTCGGDAEVELRRHDGLQVLLEGVACNEHQI